MDNDKIHEKTLAEIVIEQPAAARVFRARGMDFCCGGRVTIDVFCAKHGIDARAVHDELAVVLADDVQRRAGSDVRALTTPELLGQIVVTHHRYTRAMLPHVRAMAEKVARVHGDRNTKLRPLYDAVVALADTLIPHLDEEEQDLFPRLASGRDDADALAVALGDMASEHREVGEQLRAIRRLAEDFLAPDWACTTYRTLFTELSSLEDDLLRHIHLENHVLAPRFAVASDAIERASRS